MLIADWTDVVPAAIAAATRAEMAIVRHTPPDRDIPGALRIEIELVTLAGEPVFLEATREPIESSAESSPTRASGLGESVRISLLARVGRFGSPESERRLLNALARRLADLRGVEFRPIR